jgi:hypothetical protein
MKKVMCTILPTLAIALMLGVVSGTAVAQDNSTYAVDYYSNANVEEGPAPDGTLRLINDGDTGGSLCAAIYMFDDMQEMQECCSCPITADGLIAESVNRDLLGNSLTGMSNEDGVIKVISTNAPSGVCNPTNGAATAGIRGWLTHIEKGVVPSASATKKQPVSSLWLVGETELHDANLSAAELASLQQFCSFAIILGSGRGTCTCGLEDHAF